jgi:hypothetical protein
VLAGFSRQRDGVLRHDLERARAHHLLQLSDHLLHLQRLAKEAAIGRPFLIGQFDLTGYQDDFDRRPAVMHGVGKF